MPSPDGYITTKELHEMQAAMQKMSEKDFVKELWDTPIFNYTHEPNENSAQVEGAAPVQVKFGESSVPAVSFSSKLTKEAHEESDCSVCA